MERLSRPPESETQEIKESKVTGNERLSARGRMNIQQGEAPDMVEYEPDNERLTNTGYIPNDTSRQNDAQSDQSQQPGTQSNQSQQPVEQTQKPGEHTQPLGKPDDSQPPQDQANPPEEGPLLVSPYGIEKVEGKRNPQEDELVERPGGRIYPDEPMGEGRMRFR